MGKQHNRTVPSDILPTDGPSLGLRLRELRTEKGLAQKELAALLNLSVATISNYESNIHSPDLQTLCRLADLFEVSTDYLLTRSHLKQVPEIYFFQPQGSTASELLGQIAGLDVQHLSELRDYAGYLIARQDREEQSSQPAET